MIDAHCHIDLYPDPLAEAKRVEGRSDVVIAVTNLPSHYEMGRSHLLGFRHVRLSIGLHPLLADQHKSELAKFKELARHVNYIGEVGLDFSPEGYRTKEVQIESFAQVLEAIRDRKRFVTIHSRRADRVVLEMLRQYKIQGAVFHWFSGSKRDMAEISADGHFFSVNHAMVTNERGRGMVAAIPFDNVLTETDGPHILRNGKPIAAADVVSVLSALSELWGVESALVAERVKQNFERALPPRGSRA